MTTYVDVGRVLSLAELQVLRANGVVGVNPYLDPYNPKGCTPQYLRDIATAGLRVGGFFYETTGGSGDPGYFRTDQGKDDAVAAEHLLAGFFAAALIPDKVVVWLVNFSP